IQRATPCSSPLSFLFNPPHPPALHPLSLHDALPISYQMPPPTPMSPPTNASAPPSSSNSRRTCRGVKPSASSVPTSVARCSMPRSEEHTSELQSRENLVCRLLLEKKKKKKKVKSKQL